jgi:hypothetical protein
MYAHIYICVDIHTHMSICVHIYSCIFVYGVKCLGEELELICWSEIMLFN